MEDGDGKERGSSGAEPEHADDVEAGADDEGDGVVTESQRLRPLSLDEALSILGEETRARIVVELGDAWNADPPGPTHLSFSELMERVGAQDSGRFNYHLDKLVGTFVTKSEEGYAVRQPGKVVHRAIVAGTFTDRDGMESSPVDDCPTCEGQVTATYRSDQILVVACPDCETAWNAVYVPPRAIDGRSADELVDVATQWVYHDIAQLRRGICHGCGGTVDRDLSATVPDVWPDAFDFDVFATLACTECKDVHIGHPSEIALSTPPVVGFCHDHGLDTAVVVPWSDLVRTARTNTTVVGEDPLRVAVPYDLGGERLRVVLDDDLQVREVERTTR
jgi:hypothetical protein